MKIGIALGLSMCLLLGAGAITCDETMQGTWKLIAGEAAGKPLTEEQLRDGKLVIKGDHYRVTLAGGEPITGVQKLDPTANVKTIDITDSSGNKKEHTCLGIYELKGDEFHVAFAPPGKPRPTNFTTTTDSENWVHVWKHVKE